MSLLKGPFTGPDSYFLVDLLGSGASACAVGGVFRVRSEGFEWFLGGGGDGGGDLFPR